MTQVTGFVFYPLPNAKILHWSRLKEFADDFKFDESGRMFFKWVENTIERGETACYKQFLLFSQCFQKTCTVDIKTRVCLGKGYTGRKDHWKQRKC